MDDVFRALTGDHRVAVTGVHWASLINAYGCAAKDLDRALQIFESIPDHYAGLESGRRRPAERCPDALAFEALFNVLVAHRRADLLPKYTQHMRDLNVHMTAYIANTLIKGYSFADMDKAREVFEGLVDPPFGVAALHNHVPHRPAPHVGANALVYREVRNVALRPRVNVADVCSCSPRPGKRWSVRSWAAATVTTPWLSLSACGIGTSALPMCPASR
jgi:hypothetical protein